MRVKSWDWRGRAAFLLGGIVAAGHPFAVSAAESDSLETVLITAQRAARTSKGATGLELTLADTPQSETVIDATTLDTFALHDTNDMLKLVTGVNVEQAESDRTYYNSRGFDLTSVQVDGIGMPFDGLIVGDGDTALYDKVEVVRGANGLLTGTGNPSGTVNFVRKRPTNDFQASGTLTYGTWDLKRIDLDVSTPLVASGQWAARVVAADQSRDSWLDYYHNKRQVLYGVVDGQIGDRITVAAGFSYQDNKSTGAMWGAVPLLYSDGTQTDYPVSTNSGQDWTYWQQRTTSSFGELSVTLAPRWMLKSTATYGTYQEPSRLLYLDGTTDPSTNLGLVAYPDMFDVHTHSVLSDTSIAGSFDLFGLTHEAVLGLSLADASSHTFERDPPADQSGFDAPAFPFASGNAIPLPDFGDRYIAADTHTLFNRVYGATRLSFTKSLKLIAGFNAVDYTASGVNYGVSGDKHEKSTAPYLGATWNVVPHLNLYASYSDIFQPQDYLNPALQPIGSAKGKSYEAGAKSEWFDGKLLGTFALFKADQDNFAQFAGYAGPDFTLPYYDGISIRSQGFELEVSGKIAQSLTLHGGYTQLRMTDPSGADTRTFVPRKTFKLLGTWQVPGVAGLELGADARWQNGIRQFDAATGGTVEQGAYSILGAELTYQVGSRVEFTVRGDNLANEEFLTSLYWNQAFHGEPRNYSASVKVKL